jgi:hypothetical protein
MKIKKHISLVAVLAAFGILALAIPAFAQQSPGGHRGFGGVNGGRPAVVGTVAAVSGETLTVNARQGFGSTSPTTTYTIDATNATVTKNNAVNNVSSIAVGDMVIVQGTVSGTNVTATVIRDAVVAGGFMGRRPNNASGAMSNAMVVRGTIASISGTTLTVTGAQGFMKSSTTAQTTYIVDASTATVTKNGQTTSVSNIAVGDVVNIQGTISGTNVVAKTIRDGIGQPPIQGNGQPVVAGSVIAISGNTITITNKSNVTYTIDASNAKFLVKGVNNPTISNVTVGDSLVIQGMVNGSNVAASSVIDQKASSNPGSNNQSVNSRSGFLGGIGHMFGGLGSFFKHLFGF